MGRHSAPDDDDAPLDEPGAGQVALREREPEAAGGRHYRGDDPADGAALDPAEAQTGRIPPVTDPIVEPVAVEPVAVEPVVVEPAADEVSLDELIGAPADPADDVTERIPPVVDDRPRPAPATSTRSPVADPVVSAPPGPQAPAAGQQSETAPSRRGASPQVAVKHAAHNSAADLHLVRSHRSILLLCVLAVLIPFAVDVVVLTVLGDVTLRRFLVWIWAPLVAAGVLVGVVLDAGHRRHAPG